MADVVRQPDGAAGQRPAPLATGIDAARAELVTPSIPLMPANAGIQCLAKELGPRVRGDERR